MNRFLSVLLCVSFITFTGCWDSVSIEQRAYIIGIAIDEYPPISGKTESEVESPDTAKEEMFEAATGIHSGSPTYAMTVQLPVIKMSTVPNVQGVGSPDPGTPKTWEITQVGNSFIEMNRALATRINLLPYYGHLQVIIVSDKVAKKGLSNVLDFFARDHELRSRTRIFITRGEAKKVLDVIPRIEDYSSLYLSETAYNAKLNSQMVHWTDFGKTIQSIYSGRDFLLPIVNSSKDEIMNKGAALFKGDKLVATISGREVEALKMIRNLFDGGIITAKMPNNESSIMALEIDKLKSRITPIIEEDNVAFKIDIKINGDYSENVNCPFTKKIDKSFLEEASEAFEASIKKQCVEAIQKVQSYGTDLFLFNAVLKAEKPSYWDKVKDEWYDIFPHVKTEVNVKVNLKQIGNIQ
ncbi:MAG TPA: Ger(x)C family spore germination protein [Acetivibrio sp.]|nr:Ger(x)C family spore germination protein [Acetivibrio sp.]